MSFRSRSGRKATPQGEIFEDATRFLPAVEMTDILATSAKLYLAGKLKTCGNSIHPPPKTLRQADVEEDSNHRVEVSEASALKQL